MQGFLGEHEGCACNERISERSESTLASLPHDAGQLVAPAAAVTTRVTTLAFDHLNKNISGESTEDNVHVVASDMELQKLLLPCGEAARVSPTVAEGKISHGVVPPCAASMGDVCSSLPGRALSPLSSLSSSYEQRRKHDEKKQQQTLSTDDILHQHKKHIFILTSSGRPVFTRYGDENALGDLFGVFQVLMTVAQQWDDDDSLSRKSKGNLRRVMAGDVSLYFYMEDELYYVLVTRTEESARSCMEQICQMHLQLLSLLPNAGNILKGCPSYNLRRLISPADVHIMRQLIRRNSYEECYLFRCLTAAPMSAAQRLWLQGLLTLRYPNMSTGSLTAPGVENVVPDTEAGEETAGVSMTEETEEGGEEEEYEDDIREKQYRLFSFFFFRGRIVCAVGADDADNENSGGVFLHTDDALLLLNFTRCLAHTQAGEVWAPICLPKYNNTGYLWCYCVNMSVMARKSRRGRIASRSSASIELKSILGDKWNESLQESMLEYPSGISMSGCAFVGVTPPEYTKSDGLLLVHIATCQGAFTALADRSYRIARQLTLVIGPLEEVLSERENIPLSIVVTDAGTKQQQQQKELALLIALAGQQYSEGDEMISPTNVAAFSSPSPSSSLSSPPFIHPDGLQWFAVVLRGKKFGRKRIENLVYSESSPAMRLSVQERKRELRLMVKLRDQLAQLSQSPEPLLLVNMKEMNALVMRPTITLVTSLVQQFFTASSEGPQTESHNSNTRNGASITLNEGLTACRRVRELMLLFLPYVTKPQMLRCAMRVLVRIAALEGELLF